MLWDRQENKPVVTIDQSYQRAFCLETTRPGDSPFTSIEEWFNTAGKKALESEGIPATRKPFKLNQ